MIVEARIAQQQRSNAEFEASDPCTFLGMVQVIFRGFRLSVQSQFQVHPPFRPARAESPLDAFEVSGSAVPIIDRQGQSPEAQSIGQVYYRLRLDDRLSQFVSFDRALRGRIRSSGEEALHPPIVLSRLFGRPILAYPSRRST